MKMVWMGLPLLLLGCQKKPVAPSEPIVGWHQEEGELASCYYAQSFEDVGRGDRRMVRQQVLESMMEQWSGARDDGIKFDPVVIENIETVLLGIPEKIEQITGKNTDFCRKAMAGGGTDAWASWMFNLPAQLLEGECRRPHDDTLYDYIDLDFSWYFSVDVCDDDVIEITASEMDEYRVDDDGPWVNAAGDTSKSTSGLADYPCNTEGCFAGQLVLRFRGESGATIIRPVGLKLVFQPPEHGAIEVMVNDPTPYNNEFRVVRGVQHRTGVTYTSLD
jgi:hypothetical protein